MDCSLRSQLLDTLAAELGVRQHSPVVVMEAFCGIDVACAKNKPLPIAVLVREGARLRALPLRTDGPPPPRGMGNVLALDDVVRQAFAEQTAQYLRLVEQRFDVQIVEVAIDAPREPSYGTRRAAELAMDRIGVSCISTPSRETFLAIRQKVARHLENGGTVSRMPHANQLWMLVGFELFVTVGSVYPCIEVFPNAIVNSIAPGSPHKSKSDGFERQLNAFAVASGWNRLELADSAHGSRHDRLDALMSAWIASLPQSHRIGHGDGALDTIWSVRESLPHVV